MIRLQSVTARFDDGTENGLVRELQHTRAGTWILNEPGQQARLFTEPEFEMALILAGIWAPGGIL